MSSSMRTALCALALVPTALWAQPPASTALKPSSSTLDVPIEDIAASARGCAVLDKDFPRLRKHPMYGFFKSMSLNQIAALSHGEITVAMLAQARTDLSPLSFVPAATQPVDLEDPAPPGNQASLGADVQK